MERTRKGFVMSCPHCKSKQGFEIETEFRAIIREIPNPDEEKGDATIFEAECYNCGFKERAHVVLDPKFHRDMWIIERSFLEIEIESLKKRIASLETEKK